MQYSCLINCLFGFCLAVFGNNRRGALWVEQQARSNSGSLRQICWLCEKFALIALSIKCSKNIFRSPCWKYQHPCVHSTMNCNSSGKQNKINPLRVTAAKCRITWAHTSGQVQCKCEIARRMLLEGNMRIKKGASGPRWRFSLRKTRQHLKIQAKEALDMSCKCTDTLFPALYAHVHRS